MARRRTALLEAQPALWDDEPQQAVSPPPKAPSKPTRRRLRNHVLDLPRPWPQHIPCAMTCLTCGQIEGAGICENGCAIVCGRPTPLDRETGKAPVEVCLLTLVVHARRIGPYAVISCPHCDGTHWHTPTPGRRYRVGQCGQPYIVHLPERSAP